MSDEPTSLRFLTRKMPKKKAIGIDLGSSKCCVGVVRDGRVEILENERGNKTTPSYVAFTDTERLFGDDAKDQATVNPRNTVFGVKRIIRRDVDDSSVKDVVTAMPYTIRKNSEGETGICVSYKGKEEFLLPQQITAMLLGKMKSLAEDYLKSDVDEAVISVPASFSNAQRQTTKDAAAIAGLKLLALINEPTAAAITYQDNRRNQAQETIAIVDFGAAKLDVSIVTLNDDQIRVDGVSGSTEVGGNDVDEMLMEHVFKKYKEQYPNQELQSEARVMNRLRSSCENIKKKLSILPKVQETLDCFGDDQTLRITMSRDEFRTMITPKIRNCLLRCIEDSVQTAKLRSTDISRVLLVGGSTRIPVVQEWLQEQFKCPIDRSVNPDEAVAGGTAVQAALLSGDHEVKELVIKDAIRMNFYLVSDKDSVPKPIFDQKFLVPVPSKKYNLTTDFKRNISYGVCKKVIDQTNSYSLMSEFLPVSNLQLYVDRNGIFKAIECHGKSADGSYKWRDIQYNVRGKLDEEHLSQLKNQEGKFRSYDQNEKDRTEAMTNLESVCFQYQTDLEQHQTPKPIPEYLQKFINLVKENIEWLNSTKMVSGKKCLERKKILQQENENMKSEREKIRVEAVEKMFKYFLELPFTLDKRDEVEQLRLSEERNFLNEKIVEWATLNSTFSKGDCDNYSTQLRNLVSGEDKNPKLDDAHPDE